MNDDKQSIEARNLLWISPSTLSAMRVRRLFVVGCGGNGAIFTAFAAHVGFRQFTLCDADVLDTTNLNRYVIASPDQVGQRKVEIVRSYLGSQFSGTEVDCIPAAFPCPAALDAMRSTMIVIGCVDNPSTRMELDIACRRCGCVLLDLGSGFAVDRTGSTVLASGGQVCRSERGGACLQCLGFSVQGTVDNYFLPGSDSPEPSSLLINGAVASLAVEWAVNIAAGNPLPCNKLSYDRRNWSMQTIHVSRDPFCLICGDNSAHAIESVILDQEQFQVFRELARTS